MKTVSMLHALRSLANDASDFCRRHATRRLRARHEFRRALVIEGLEGRRPLAFAITSSGTSITLTGDAADDAVVISIAPSGHFRHDLPLAGNLVSNIDTNGSIAGEQAMLATSVTSITVNAGSGNDTFDASTWTGGGLTVYGGAGKDVIKGGSGKDELRGEGGDDVIEGNGGNDELYGDGYFNGASTGNDILRGGDGNDNLYGDDRYYGGSGNDSMDGGEGTDSAIDWFAGVLVLTDSTYDSNGVVTSNHRVESFTVYGTSGNALIK